jgi:hypothetical protein
MPDNQKFEQKVDKMVQDQGELKNGITDIKNLLTAFGERLAQAESNSRVCRDVLRDLVLETRVKEYRAQVEAKLARPATLVFSRANGAGSTPPPSSTDELSDFINDKFASDEAPDFVLEPMGNRGSYKLFPETYSPMEGRRICASILQAIKPTSGGKGAGPNGGKKLRQSGEDIKSRFGMNVFYDNPLYLREIRSNALRFVASMLQDQGLKLTGKPFVRRDVMVLNEIPMFPEYLVPDDEALWASAFKLIGNSLRNPPANKEGIPPVAQAVMEDLYVAGKGMLFPKTTLFPTDPMDY